MWENSPKIFSCTISNPTKESKYYNIKNFIAYEVKASVSLKLQRHVLYISLAAVNIVSAWGG